jgi:hypothetical protein
MRVSFSLNEDVRNIALALHCSPKSPTRAGPGHQAPPPRSSRVAESWSWNRGKWQAAGAAFAVGKKAVLTLLYPPLEPLSHNANPRDGAQDICAWVFICTPEGVSFSGSSHEVGGQETPVEMSCSHVFLSGDAMLSHIVVCLWLVTRICWLRQLVIMLI